MIFKKMDIFDLKNSVFALGGAKIMAMALNVDDIALQVVMAVILAVVGATASFFWRHYILTPIREKLENLRGKRKNKEGK